MSYYTSNDPLAKNIYNLIDSVDNRLSQRNRSNSYLYQNKQNNMNMYPYKNLDNFRNNPITASAQFNQNNLPNNTQLSNYDLRKMIKEEFESLIKPFEQEVFKRFNEVESDMTNIKKNYNNNNLLNSKNDLYKSQNFRENMKKNLYDNAPFKDFDKKMKDLEEKIEKKDKNEKMVIYTMSDDIKKVKDEVQEIKNKCKEIEESNKIEAKKYYNAIEMNKNDEKLKEIKLKDNEDKISFLQKELESLRKNADYIKNNENSKILEYNNNSLNELRDKYNSLSNFDIKYNKINSDVSKLKDNLQKLNKMIGDLNNRISDYENNFNFNKNMNMNINYESKIQEVLKNLGLEKDKIALVFQKYEQILKNYIKISKIVEYQNNSLNDLTLKFNILNQNKEKNEILNNNKNYDLLDRQVQYMQNQLERISIDLMNRNKNDDEYKFKKENILLFQKDIENMKKDIGEISRLKDIENIKIDIENIKKDIGEISRLKDIENIKKDIGEINRLIENEQTKKDEEKERINKILNELKEENKDKIEEENKIKSIEDNHNMLKQIEKEVKRIDEDFKKFEAEKKKKIEEEKIKRIEDENRLKINEEKIKKLEEIIEENKNIGNNPNSIKPIIVDPIPKGPPAPEPVNPEDNSDDSQNYEVEDDNNT